jgi:hypothetical protein
MTINRHTILTAIARWHECGITDLRADLGGDNKRLHDNINAAVTEKLVERFSDLGKPAYRLTAKGKAWLLNRPTENGQQEVPPNTCIDASASGVDTATNSTEGVDVATKPQAKPPKPSGKGVEAAKPAGNEQIGGTHYINKAVQPWDAMQAWMTPEQFAGFLMGNSIKYLARWQEKGGVEDLCKARHYLDKLIEVAT